jgi:autotransporter-associated beta strand protein
MKNLFPGRTLFVITILAAIFTPSLRAQLTWSGAGGDANWSTGANWAGTPPVTGDALIFAGSTQLVNTNDLILTSNAWLRFNSGNFTLWGNALACGSGTTNTTGTNRIALDLSWNSASRTFNVAAGSELIIAGNEVLNSGDCTNLGGGRIRLTGTHSQPPNTPATILNNIEYVIDGGSFSNAGGVRITSGTSPTASTLILTNGAIMIQALAAGAVRVGDVAGIQAQMIVDHSMMTNAGNNIFIPFASGGIGSVIQRGGTNSGALISFCNNATTGGTGSYDMTGGLLGATQIRKVSTTGTATMSFDGSTVRALAASTTFFTGLDTAQIKSGGLIFDNNGFNVTVNQTFTGVGGLTKIGSGTLTLGSTAGAYSGGFTLNEGVVSLTQNNAFGTGTLTVNGGTMQPSASANRNCTNAVTIGGDYTADGNANVTWSGPVTLTGDRIINVNIPATAGAHVMSGSVGETGGSRSITKAGPGVLQLTGSANSYSGNTVISNGAVQVNSTSRLGNEAGTLVLAGGALYSSANRTVSTSPIGNAINLITDSEIATVSTAATVDLNLTGVPAGTNGTLMFRNLVASGTTNTFEPRFSAGGFSFGQPIAIINNTNGSSFTRLNFFNTNGGGDQTFSGLISGNGSIRRSASIGGTGGRTILTAANTYSGLTTISDGTLVADNTSGSGTGSGDIALTSNGILAGSGSVAGAVSGNGSVSAGDGVGTLAIGNGLDLSSGGTNIWELAANTTSGAGTSFDDLVLTAGNLVLGGGSRVLIKFSGTATFPDSTNAFWQQTNTWKIIDLTGPAANPGLAVFAGVDGAAGNTAGSFTTIADATGIYLTFTPGVQAPPPLIDSNIAGAGTANAQLKWSSVAGATYKVQYKTNLDQIDWLDLTNLTATGTSTTIADTTTPVPTQRFYRVISP